MQTSLQLRMQYQADALTHLLFGLAEDNAKQRPNEDKWSIFENIAHLGRYQEIFLQRMKIIDKEESPLFERYIAGNDEGFHEWCRKTLDETVGKFYSSRMALNEYLFSLNDIQLKRTARHPVFGQMNINGWCEFFLLHESHHYFTILKLIPQINSAE